MANLRIVDAPLLSTVKGTEKIPTGGEGNFSVSVNQVADFAKLKWVLATEGYVNNTVGNVQADLNLHKNNKSNPHNVTKTQVGLGNVDNTADLDKPVSNATQSALDTKADKTQVITDLNLKADKITTYTKTEVDSEFYGIYQNGAALPYDAAMEYAEDAIVVKDGVLQQWKAGAWVKVVTWSNIENKPTTITGYGITDTYTKIEADNTFVESTQVATTAQEGIVQLVNDLTTGGTDKALTAEMGKQSREWLDVIMYSPIPYPKIIPPAGFLMMMGQAISQATHPKLYALYDGTLPDMRGTFIRGWDNGRGFDSGRSLLAYQADDLKSHNHPTNITSFSAMPKMATTAGPYTIADIVNNYNPTTGDRGGDETRPKNVAFNYIVKAG